MVPQPHEVERAIVELAARQELTVSMPQLADLGLSGRAVRKRVQAGRLYRQHRGVYSLVPALTRRGQFFAAVLACGREAALSHQSAAYEHEIRRHDHGPVHVTVPTTGARSRWGIVMHASPSADTIIVNGMRVTTPARTLTDLADILTPSALQLAVSSAERKGLIDRDRLAPAPGRRRVTERPHLFTRSQNERAFFALCQVHGLPLPKANQDVHGREADFYWVEHQLVFEIDAWHTHGNRRSFEGDRLKDEHYEDHGIRVRRVTDTRLHGEPDAVAARVRRALVVRLVIPRRK